MFRKLFVQDFQRAAQANLKLAPVTFLVGENGHGKTSIAEAIEFALTGEPPRGVVLADVRRHGADAAEVEITLADEDRTTLARRVTEKTTTRKLNDEKTADKAFDAAVLNHVGDPRAMRAALRSGGLLSMSSADLQKFLADLTGAKFDTKAIAEALGAEIAVAAEKYSLPLPASIGEFPACEKKAAEKRVIADRLRKEREATLANTPAAMVDAGTRTVAEIQASVAVLRAEHEAAVRAEEAAGADAKARHEERVKLLRANLVKAESDCGEAKKKAEGTKLGREASAIERDLAETRRTAAGHEADAASYEKTIGQAEKVDVPKAGDRELAARVEELQAKAAEARQSAEDEERTNDALRRDYVTAREELKNGPDGGTCSSACEHCTVANAARHRAELTAKLTDIETRGKASAAKADELAKTRDVAEKAADDAVAAKRRVTADDTRSKARTDLAIAKAAAEAAREVEKNLLAELDAVKAAKTAAETVAAKKKAYHEARAAFDALDATAFPQPTEPKAAGIKERLAREESLLEAAKARDAWAKAQAAVDSAKAEWEAANSVAKALGKDGVLPELLAGGVQPFLDAANEALAVFAPGWRVAVCPDPFGVVLVQGESIFRGAQLSDGHLLRFAYILQVAIAKLSGFRFVVFDRAELLDAAGRQGLDALLLACVEAEIQVLVLKHGAPPVTDGETTVAYVVEDGVARKAGAVALPQVVETGAASVGAGA